MDTLASRLFLSAMDPAAPELARQEGLGLELTEFSYAPNLEDPERIALAQEQMEGLDRFWLHGPFAELAPCAVDPLIRDVAARRFLQTLTLARQLGIRRVVLHGGFQPHAYFPQWYVEQSVLFWKDLLPKIPVDMTLALENVLEPEPSLLAAIARQVDDPRIRLCLDVGHANLLSDRLPVLSWVRELAPWLVHVHLHNNGGASDAHAPLDQGTVPVPQVLTALDTLCPAATVTLESRDCQSCLSWLRRQGYLPGKKAFSDDL